MVTIWTVYNSPTDHPGLYVARRSVDGTPTADVIFDADFAILRSKLAAKGLRFLAPRSPGDDPKIVETWI